jgi:hypothetical protein
MIGRINIIMAAGLATVAVSWTSIADARAIAEPVTGRVESASTVQTGDGCPPQAVCCPKPCITYRHRGPKLCCGCEPGVPTVLLVKDPCTCCEVEVPVCLPACCQGEPTVCSGVGFLGRDIVDYEWCCGFSVRVVFKHSGDLLVTTWGR